MYTEIEKCRISGSSNLVTVMSLGEQYLTGVFPKSLDQEVSKGPVDLVWCPDSGLVQMKQSFNASEMYGDNYGYRSGLNQSMVRHLAQKIRTLENIVELNEEDLVIDIGSNDGTSLKSYSGKHKKVGIDPTGYKFREYYSEDITLISDFFTKEKFKALFPGEKAKIITSIAMFYDLEQPLNFVRDIEACLDDQGIWHFEQSYLPSMLRTNSYDTICHEHIEYYSLQVVKNMLEVFDLRIVDVQLNSINGGSFAVTACKKGANFKSNTPVINWLIQEEIRKGLNTIEPYLNFQKKAYEHKSSLLSLLNALVADGKKIFGYGASTKGNVLLQFCGLNTSHIQCIAEVNEEKFGTYTPGTNIPIISEADAKNLKPDYFLVLPWHFRNSILNRETEFLESGGKFIFPLPEIEII